MKTGKVLLISSVFVVVVSLAGIAQDRYVAKADEEIYGTWVSENLSKTQLQKYVLGAGIMKRYRLLSDSTPLDEATFEIDARWTDSDGNVWYRTHGVQTTGIYKDYSYVELDKVNKAGTIWEAQFFSLGYKVEIDPAYAPKAFDPNSSYHGFQYRYRPEE